ncbi:MAG: oxidoreductase [Proteobacteria bacterium]|nr:oxidoreductase [Pseudomonadota bacterium]
MSERSALLVGASGLVGGHCLKFLLESDRYEKVITLIRKLLITEHQKLEQHEIVFDRLEQYPELIAANDIFCCLGTTIKQAGSQKAFSQVDFTYPYETAKAARRNGAESLSIITAIGANPNSPFFYNRVKGNVENTVSRLGFPRFYIFRPSLLLGERREPRLGEKFAQGLSRKFSSFLAGPLKKYRPIEAEVVAFAMVQMAREGPAGVNIFESDQIQAIYDKYQIGHCT